MEVEGFCEMLQRISQSIKLLKMPDEWLHQHVSAGK
jgi:hypothetical protein